MKSQVRQCIHQRGRLSLLAALLAWALLISFKGVTAEIDGAKNNAFPLIEITDSHGKYQFDQPPQRFVSLNWAITEQLLDLGEIPQGIADFAAFKRLSSHYQFDAFITDLGPRLSPDLEKIKKLKPEVIFIGYSQRALLRPLSNIATVIYFKNFGQRYDNASKADERFNELSKLFRKQAHAIQRLDERSVKIGRIKNEVKNTWLGVEKLSFLLVAPTKNVNSKSIVFGNNSLPKAAMDAMGLRVISPEDVDKFGVAHRSYAQLTEIVNKARANGNVCVLLFDQYSQQSFTLPEIAKCQHVLSYQQAFGGAMSVNRLAQAVLDLGSGLTDQ